MVCTDTGRDFYCYLEGKYDLLHIKLYVYHIHKIQPYYVLQYMQARYYNTCYYLYVVYKLLISPYQQNKFLNLWMREN
jgi:hypothetical protein